PEDPTVNINLKDDTLPNGNCVAAINEKYADNLTWTGTGVFEAVKPENGIKIGTDTVITINVVGEVSLLAGYELPVSDYVITYKDGKATIKFVAATGQYGSFVGGIVIDTSKTPEDTQTVNVTVDYNDDGATANGTIVAVVGSPLTKPADPVRDGFKFAGWKVNGADYNFTENVTEAFILVAQWESQGDYDLTAGGSVNLNEFTTGQINGGSSATYRGVIIEVSEGQKFAPRPNSGDAQVNASETAPVKIKFKVNAGTTKEQIGISFTAAAGANYLPTFTVDVETVGDDTYAVVSITSNSYPTTMTVTIS
ncbi:MAG: InlB B-repeat-containing protein, partial [Clostridia bacterium]|nr:InlB B-repeat-containing protein [Clostridia bacterium]